VTRCPRCHRAPQPTERFCACGAPLLLGDETPRSVDAALQLDRRGAGAPAAAVAAISPPPAPLEARPASSLAELSRADWDLLTATAAGPGPAPSAPPPADDGLPDPDVDALEVHVERAASWRRAAAWAIDVVPFAVAGGALGRSLVSEAGWGLAAPSGIDGLLDLVAHERVIVLSVAAAAILALVVYATLAHALAGATLGKRLLRLRVIGPDGAPPSPARSALRSAVAVASAGTLGLGFVLALFTRSGRALHDLIARTWVVKAP
jgi:uncharacterized RDD family membrane protein YckC